MTEILIYDRNDLPVKTKHESLECYKDIHATMKFDENN